jgi:hypothetical protein
MRRREFIAGSGSFHQMIRGAARERGSAAPDQAHGIFTRVLKIQFPEMMSRINVAAARKFSSMR